MLPSRQHNIPKAHLGLQLAHRQRELLFRQQRMRAHTETIVVDRLRRIVQKGGDTGGVRHSEAHHGIDAQLGRKKLSGLWPQLIVGAEESIYFLDEIGKDVKDYSVEFLEERLQMLAPPALPTGASQYRKSFPT